jgi:GNAT superfamily N-acetyltransferase
MLVKFPPEKRDDVKSLFNEYPYLRLVINQVFKSPLGEVWADHPDNPRVAMVVIAGIHALTGSSGLDAASELLGLIPEGHPIVAPDTSWLTLVRRKWGEKVRVQTRTVFSSDGLDMNHVRKLKGKLPDGYNLKRIDLKTARAMGRRGEELILPFFGSLKTFIECGVGFCVMHGQIPVSAAFSGLPIEDDLFDVQVYTVDEPRYRRTGYATMASAALIEHSLENGLEPHWDAQNEPSIKMALKLGYTDPVQYDIYYWKE